MAGPGAAEAPSQPASDRGSPAPAEHGDEPALVAAAKRDRRDFEPLYRRYVDPVYRYCRRRLDDPDLAADATALVFAKALAALPGCREDAFRPWLFAIARNVVTDGYRNRRPTAPLAAAAGVPDGRPSPEEEAIAGERRRALRAALERLPEEQRAVVELRLAGLSAAEIGAVLGKRPGAVDAAQFRAVRRLRALLGVEPNAGKGRGAGG
jgi:RNA polymerase sigma-70 factor (ECF subfamily)